jgi:hypothetical protein
VTNFIAIAVLVIVAIIAMRFILRRSENRQLPGPLLDQRVRLALNHAVNRKKLLAVIEPDREEDELISELPSYDPERAKQLLSESGYSPELELKLAVPYAELVESPALLMIIEDLAVVGVAIQTQVLSLKDWSQRAVNANEDGRTLYYGGAGLFFVQIGVDAFELESNPENAVRQFVRDLAKLDLAGTQPGLSGMITASALISDIVRSVLPRSPRSRRRMTVWMREDGAESLVGLVAWWPGFVTASRTNYASSISDLISNTLNDAVDEGACFERLEIMSHGNGQLIKMGRDTLARIEFDATGAPSTQRARRLLDGLKAAMCPTGQLIFTACGQGDGKILRNISRYIQGAIRVSGYSATGYPDGIPVVDLAEPDLHFINGSTASAPP